METKAFRSQSLARLAKVGILLPSSLPLIDDFSVRPIEEIVDRILCLNAVAAAAHGFSGERATAWLSGEHLLGKLTEDERSFLGRGNGKAEAFKVQVEGMWALSWMTGIVDEIDFQRQCDPRFVTLLPNLKIAENSSSFRTRAHLRGHAAIGAEVDLAYCLHWAVREAEISGTPAPAAIAAYIVVQRRRALDWAIGNQGWNEVPIDT